MLGACNAENDQMMWKLLGCLCLPDVVPWKTVLCTGGNAPCQVLALLQLLAMEQGMWTVPWESPLLVCSLLFLEEVKMQNELTQVKGHPYCLSYRHLPWRLGPCGGLRPWHHEVALLLVDITRSVPSASSQPAISLPPPGMARVAWGWPAVSCLAQLPLRQLLSWFPFQHFNSFLWVKIFLRRDWREWIPWYLFTPGISAGWAFRPWCWFGSC